MYSLLLYLPLTYQCFRLFTENFSLLLILFLHSNYQNVKKCIMTRYNRIRIRQKCSFLLWNLNWVFMKFFNNFYVFSTAGFSTPLVCLVIEGGTNTIRAVLEYVTASPPVPVVVCDGTGRAADLLAFCHRWVKNSGNFTIFLSSRSSRRILKFPHSAKILCF